MPGKAPPSNGTTSFAAWAVRGSLPNAGETDTPESLSTIGQSSSRPPGRPHNSAETDGAVIHERNGGLEVGEHLPDGYIWGRGGLVVSLVVLVILPLLNALFPPLLLHIL